MLSFLHTADLHLGLRLTRFDKTVADRLREARFTALDNLLKEARQRRVDFLLIAGDLFDDIEVDLKTARTPFDMLEAAAAPVFVLPGNHDPLQAGSVWDRAPWNEQGTRVRLLRDAEPVEAVPGVTLLPCPVLRRTSLDDPTAWIANSPRQGSDIRIGVGHGSLKYRDDLPPDDHPIAYHAASDLDLDYLALGHWHCPSRWKDRGGVERTAYPGVHEPMGFLGSKESRTGWVPYSGGSRAEFFDAGRGEVLHVRLSGPKEAPALEPVAVQHYSWHEESYTLASGDDLGRLIENVATREAVERRLLRLRLTGVVDAETMLRLDRLRDILGHRYFFGELDESGLHVQPTADEMREAAGAGVLQDVLTKLRGETASGDVAVRAVAERALLLLYQIAREVKA